MIAEFAVFTVLATQQAATPPPSEPPVALQRMLAARQAIGSGNVDWTWTSTLAGPERKRHYRSRFARNGDMIFEDRGDDAGWVRFDPGTGEGTSRFPEVYLSNAEGFWLHSETARSARLYDRSVHPAAPQWPREENGASITAASLAERVLDVRWLGIHYDLESLSRGDYRLRNPGRQEGVSFRWEAESRDGKHVVRQIVADGWTTEWIIDPDRGWNADSITITSPSGEHVAESHCVLEQLGDAWFPAFVSSFRQGILVAIVEIESGSFATGEGDAEFTAAAILEPGVQVSDAASGMQMVWDGEGVISWRDWREGVDSGHYQPGSNILRAEAGIPSPYATPEQIEERAARLRELRREMAERAWFGKWEQFVAETIIKYNYGDRQTKEAREVLKRCQDRASECLDSARDRFDKGREELASARRDGDAERIDRAERKIETLRKPVDEIFERMLKPRVLALATDQQRAAAHEGPSEESESKRAQSPP